jgi:cytoskeletal protein CcmA (bactofilin family)
MKLERKATKRMIKLKRPVRGLAHILGICFLTIAVLSAAAPAAGAAGPQRQKECTGTLEGGVVNGDLVVPAEAACKLNGTTVRGDVRVGNAAMFDAERARITGTLRIGELAAGNLSDTRVGDVEIIGYWAHLDMFEGAISGRVRVQDAERINLLGTTVTGDVRFERSRLFVADGATIKGQIKVSGAETAIVDESRVTGSVAIQGVTFEARICGSQLGGPVTFEGNSGNVTVGDHLKYCMGSTIDGDLLILQNTGGATISGNTVRRNLTCRDNNPAPNSYNNWVRGQKQGQCAVPAN